MDNSQFIEQAKLISSLANPTRLQIIHLVRNHSLTVSQITSMLGISQSLVSQNLKNLKDNRIISSQKTGKEVYYYLEDNRFLVACDAIRSLVANEPLPDSPEPTVIDPVCKMKLTPSTAPYSDSYQGVRHYFCALGCYQEFKRKASQYVA
jgi:YHS domain-containing protein/DNA-binding HxlR family transcriptional regulator